MSAHSPPLSTASGSNSNNTQEMLCFSPINVKVPPESKNGTFVRSSSQTSRVSFDVSQRSIQSKYLVGGDGVSNNSSRSRGSALSPMTGGGTGGREPASASFRSMPAFSTRMLESTLNASPKKRYALLEASLRSGTQVSTNHYHQNHNTSIRLISPSFGGTMASTVEGGNGAHSVHLSRIGSIADSASTIRSRSKNGSNNAVAVKRIVQRDPFDRQYEKHPLLLNFLDPEVEQRYFNFQYVDNMFIPGKMFATMWTGIPVMFFIFFTDPFHDNASYTVESFSSIWWIGSYIGPALCALLFIGLFVDRLRPYREIIHLLQIFIGWPAIALGLLVLKRPAIFINTCLFMAYIFCMIIAQGRFRYILPLTTIWPQACLFTVTFAVPGYWDTHTYIEMLYWAVFLMPLLLLFFLERQTRKSFVSMEQSTKTVTSIVQRTIVTQRMIANFFPPTPTRDLLQADSPTNMAYKDTVLIVTDIAGFTAYTSKSSPADVIDMLTTMFQSFDKTAEAFGVEKIATVGDMYCGAIFATSAGGGSAKARCKNGVVFACSSVGFAGYELELRVGVHIGDVVGAFVGCAPPKFDLFGPGIEHAKAMEETGQPGVVHVSNAVVMAVDMATPPDIPKTPLGVLCRTWLDLCGFTSGLSLLEDITDVEEEEDILDPLNAEHIVEALCDIARIDPPVEQDGGSESEGHETDAVSEQTSKDEVDSDPLRFSKVYLTFDRPSVEKSYQVHMESNGINNFCARLFVALAFALLIIHINLQCGTSQDQGITSAALAIIVCLSTYIQYVGTKHRFHAPITFISYNVLQVVTFLGLRSDCSGLEMRAKYISDIAASYFCVALFAPQYCLNIKLVHRMLMTLATSVIMAVCMIIRGYAIGDDVAALDPTPLFGGVFVIMSFFPEYSLRSAFRTEMQLTRLRKVAKSRGAAMSTSALSIMLPTFVTEKLVALAKDAQVEAEDAFSDTATASVSQYDAGDIDFNGLTATWEYNHTIIMFAEFKSSDASFTPDTINMTVQAIEQIMKGFNVMKVKTIGSSIMLVSGIDDMRTRQDQLAGMVDAAIVVRTCVFQKMNIPNLSYRVGIHCGPCFGAVIGGNGAIFDLFGDTVNTASRMMTTSQDGSIQLSSAATLLLPIRQKEAIAAQTPVKVKGKGTMEAFAFGPHVNTNIIPTFSRGELEAAAAMERWQAHIALYAGVPSTTATVARTISVADVASEWESMCVDSASR